MVNTLLIGCGSVGLKHLEVLKTFTNSIDIVDLKDISNLIKDDADITQYSNINDINSKKRYELIVIATWANSHYELLKTCIRFKPIGIIIEKPLSNSIKSCQEIIEIAEENGINILCNFTRSISIMSNEIQKYFSLNNDEILAMKWETSGNCLATNGIHWYNMAENIFNSEAAKAEGKTYLVKENPRSPDLNFLQGHLTFYFNNDRKLFLSTEKKIQDNYIYFIGNNTKVRLTGNSLELEQNGSYKEIFKLSFNFYTELLKIYHEVLNPSNINIHNIKSTENFLSLVIPLIYEIESSIKLYNNLKNFNEIEVPLS
jgi:predicted dehydrogenase